MRVDWGRVADVVVLLAIAGILLGFMIYLLYG
jgi:hypothetical protein